jgi:hypothetical protein
MREKVAAIIFIIILAFIAVFSAEIFDKLFIDVNNKFSEAASGAFLGAFLAFLFVRLGDFFKSYSDRVTKGHSSLIKLEHTLNNLLGDLDDNVYIIDIFESNYQKHSELSPQDSVFLWGNRLSEVSLIGDLKLELLNIDLINELFVLDVYLRKLNDSINTVNSVYVESKDALLGGNIDKENYQQNLINVKSQLLDMKKFYVTNIDETKSALSAVRILARKRPLMSYVLRVLAGHKYGNKFEVLREAEINKLNAEISHGQEKGKERINNVMNMGK